MSIRHCTARAAALGQATMAPAVFGPARPSTADSAVSVIGCEFPCRVRHGLTSSPAVVSLKTCCALAPPPDPRGTNDDGIQWMIQ